MKWTMSYNQYLKDNVRVKQAILITLGFVMDLMMLLSFALWSIYGKSWRYPLSIVWLYLLHLFFVVSIIFSNSFILVDI
jgi:hypothetical protein